jgi:DNA-binding GntR family transcriptional regulator
MVSRSDKIGIHHLRIQTAPEAAAQAIREAIISGELRGGDRIIERKWAAHLGIGQQSL